MKMFFRDGEQSILAIDSDHVPMPGDHIDAWDGEKFVVYIVESRRWVTGTPDFVGMSPLLDVTIFCKRAPNENRADVSERAD